MLIVHEESDDFILSGWEYFFAWRESRNYLLLFDALDRLDRAERSWLRAGYRKRPLRREWQVLRRCITAGLSRLREPLNAATTPSQTQKALYGGGKRAPIARVDQLNVRSIRVALLGSGWPGVNFDVARATLESWGIPRKRSYLIKFASQYGLTRRPLSRRPSKAATAPPSGPFKWPNQFTKRK